jgi:hypothetical protein
MQILCSLCYQEVHEIVNITNELVTLMIWILEVPSLSLGQGTGFPVYTMAYRPVSTPGLLLRSVRNIRVRGDVTQQ